MSFPRSQPPDTVARSARDEAAKQLIENSTGARVISKLWHCDVIRAHAKLIKIYNISTPDHPPEPKFSNIQDAPRRLRELLWEDYVWLTNGRDDLRQLAGDIAIVEIAGPNPNAHLLTFNHEEKPLHVIGFSSPLVHLINATFSKIWCLNHTFTHAGCLPQFDDRMNSARYSDTALVAGLYNDIEVLFELDRIYLPIEPPHIADPFNYCERVEGARRFTIAHEVSHILYAKEPVDPQWVGNVLDGPYFTARVQKEWSEELWCDSTALGMIQDCYQQTDLNGSALYELENALVGILNLFILYDIIEQFLLDRKAVDSTHPPAYVRLLHVRNVIKTHRNYHRSAELQSTLKACWRRLHSFRNFIAGLDAPEEFGKQWSLDELLCRLSSFGKEVYWAQRKEIKYRGRYWYRRSVDLKSRTEDEF